MNEITNLVQQLDKETKQQFKHNRTILSFQQYLERLKANPSLMIRNAGQYIKDAFDYFGTLSSNNNRDTKITRFKLFDQGTEKNVPIIGAEMVGEEIYKILTNFSKQGFANKLILLHGPNGSAKTSIVESISYAMHRYSKTDEGAVYKFSWIFPTDKKATPSMHASGETLGFKGGREVGDKDLDFTSSYAFCEEGKIASKIHSEYKENPLFLIPMPKRLEWLKAWIAKEEDCDPATIELPLHIQLSGLSKRNKLIYEQLLAAYGGNISQVLRHIQVERFYYSRQYRVGIGTVEPQMSIDAVEKQLTMDKNISNIPTVLHNISFFEAFGPLVEANRGLLEFSDLLKRPIEAFKYLLTTIEKSSLNLPSSTANLDIVFFATTNEKHLDAFKGIPDFASFRGRFELITVPYLMSASKEVKIYADNVKIIARKTKISPHSIYLLCLWAVMTRLKQPNPERYDSTVKPLIDKLDPLNKAKLYDDAPLDETYSKEEARKLAQLKNSILHETRSNIDFEGRYGASPREIIGILYRAAQNKGFAALTPMAIFYELQKIVKDRSVYEFLQLEPKGDYHQPAKFVEVLRGEFAKIFEKELTLSMTLVEEKQYDLLIRRYIDHVVAYIKKEKLFNEITKSYEDPQERVMEEVEKVLDIREPINQHREAVLGQIAAFKIDNPQEKIDVTMVFKDYLTRLQDYYHKKKQILIKSNLNAMLAYVSSKRDDIKDFKKEDLDLAVSTLKELKSRFGYDEDSAKECLKFLVSYQKHSKKK